VAAVPADQAATADQTELLPNVPAARTPSNPDNASHITSHAANAARDIFQRFTFSDHNSRLPSPAGSVPLAAARAGCRDYNHPIGCGSVFGYAVRNDLCPAHSFRGQTLPGRESRDQQRLSLCQRRRLVLVITMIALVVAAFPVMPFETNYAPLNPVGDRPSPDANDGISRVCPSGSGEGGLS
jgi:hypothetical protein